MARIFLSHSSSDNDLARALRDWLVAEGWNDLFLDFDPERGIAAGEKWEKALLTAATRCEAVLFVVTRNWLASGWCLKEFHLSDKLHKRMFMLLVDGLTVPDLPPELTAEWQLVDLTPGADCVAFQVSDGISAEAREVRFSSIGLRRLRSGLNRAGLDPRFFAWPPQSDPDRAPYRGLRALESDDAGIFFGREAPTIAALDRMRGLRDAAPPRLLAILGASGAGKSSFLRAGLLPRLQRDDRHFCTLPVIRPERAVMSGENGFIGALASMFAQLDSGISRAQTEHLVTLGPQAILRILGRLADVMRVPPLPGEPAARAPSLVLSIDQGEELFLAEGAEEAHAFLNLLNALMASPDLNLIVLVAIRSDSYERLQTTPELESVKQETLSLPPMPHGAYDSIINGPARRLSQSGRSLVVEPALTQALLADIEAGGAKDALPLLAFTMELLYARHGQDGRLNFADYRALGGIKGSIEVAVDLAMAAADADPRIPRDPAQRLALMRAAFIPWLAGVDLASNTVRRRVARMAEVPPEARPMVECLIGARLLATDVALDGEVTVEPAHEALLRQWGLLQGWLAEDFAAMAALQGVQRAARDWEANLRDPGWLAHSAGRLEDAEASHAQENLKTFLAPSERDYLRACRMLEDETRNRELEEARKLAAANAQVARRTRIGLGVALVLLAAASVAGWYATVQRDKAEEQTIVAQAQTRKAQASLSVANAREAVASHRIAQGAGHALAGFRRLPNLETRSALLETGLKISPHLEFTLPLGPDESVSALAWIQPDRLAVAFKRNAATGLETVELAKGRPPQRKAGWAVPKLIHDQDQEAAIIALHQTPEGLLLSALDSGALVAYRPDGSALPPWLPPAQDDPPGFQRALFSADGTRVLFAGSAPQIVTCAPLPATATALSCALQALPADNVMAVDLRNDGAQAYAALSDGTILIIDDKAALVKLTPAGTENIRIHALRAAENGFAALIQPPDTAPGQDRALALLTRTGETYAIAARAPVRIGTPQVLDWRVPGREVIHACPSEDFERGPLCATALVDTGAAPAAWLASRTLPGHSGAVDQLAISADGMRAASRGPDGLRIWRWPSDHAIHGAPVTSLAGGWASLRPAPDGRRFLLSGKDGLAQMMQPGRDPPAQDALPTLAQTITDSVAVPGGRVVANADTLAFVPDGAAEPAASVTLPAPIIAQGGLAWTGKGRRVAFSLDDQRIGIVDLAADSPAAEWFAEPTQTFLPFGLAVDATRNQLLAGSMDGRVYLFNRDSHAPLGTLANTHVPDVAVLLGAEGLAVSPDGRWLATTAAQNRIMLYDLAARTSRALLRTPQAETKAVAFNRAGTRLAALDQEGYLTLWSLEGDAPDKLLELRLPPTRVAQALPALHFTDDGGLIVLTPTSDVLHLSLDEAAWMARITALGYAQDEQP